ncbi:hypothetical protein [Promicromonospora soli]|uniref:Parallel beta helix pectate lyase-like protein n=1 Tax=Promicromonospora soli TaxID=2035533 RepID=A0A919FVB9_9MICO|nr:hypothetical protein [Promicromonospora soli]GHH72584.1 hypothetical protein GCM10017772_22400 [Promicromonospora soli]
MSEDDRRATMGRIDTPSWRVALRWTVGALVAVLLTTLGPVPPASPPDVPEAPGASDGGDTPSAVGDGVPITFPTATTAGLPEGWSPRRTHTGDLRISEAGTVVQDLRITDGTIYVEAKNVTLRRVHAVGSNVVNDVGDTCGSGLVIEASRFEAGSEPTRDSDLSVIGNGGFTVRNVVIDGLPEGIRVGAKKCGDVVVERSFIRVIPPEICQDWHGDGIQGYGGGSVTVKQTRIVMSETTDCSGTAPFFYPSGQGNTSLNVDGLLVEGGGYAFRAGTPGTVRNLQVVRDSWGYGPVDVLCSALGDWQAHVVTVSDGRTAPGDAIECGGSGT